MKLLLAPVALLALVSTAPALARDARVAVAGNSYFLPVPDGYCDTGKGVDKFVAAKGAPPVLVLVRCGEDAGSDFYVIDLSPETRPVNREVFLAQMLRTMPGRPSGLAAINAEAMTQRLGEAIDDGVAGKGDFRAIGVDDLCAYAVSTKNVATGGKTGTIAVSCATVINQRVAYLIRYLPAKNADQAKMTLPGLRHMVEVIAPAATT